MTISNRRPIPVTALQEEQVADYPDWATRELLMNALCQRDYTSQWPNSILFLKNGTVVIP